MPTPPGEPLRKVTLNLYDADVTAMATFYGHGWSEQIRNLVHQHITTATSFHKLRQTLGDLE